MNGQTSPGSVDTCHPCRSRRSANNDAAEERRLSWARSTMTPSPASCAASASSASSSNPDFHKASRKAGPAPADPKKRRNAACHRPPRTHRTPKERREPNELVVLPDREQADSPPGAEVFPQVESHSQVR